MTGGGRGGRLLIVSNRLPVRIRHDGDTCRVEPSGGGLASGVRAAHQPGRSLWIGWPGDTLVGMPGARHDLDARLAAEGLVPVHLSPQAIRRYYDGFCNGVLWPLCHYLLDRVPAAGEDWKAYRDANEVFADAVASVYRPGDTIWIHDYHLLLLPGLLRTRLPGARIGFFLHIPFPSSELFRTLPQRDDLLEGVLGADLVGFHTDAYLRHFIVALRHLVGLAPADNAVALGDRLVRLGCFPMGVDAAAFERIASDAGVVAEAVAIREDAGDRRLLLGVDRLDYTKGIPRRLLAFERFLDRHPSLAGHIRFVQLAVPSRGGTGAYQAFRTHVEEIVGRINGRFGSVGDVPVYYLHRSITREALVALFRAADVMMVTPVRDGMNLVAKEFVASRTDEDGVLILSEFAGAAAELTEAIVVNPFDIDGVADAIGRALAMPADESRRRMRTMRTRVARHDVHRWVADFLGALDAATRSRAGTPEPAAVVDQLGDRLIEMLGVGPLVLALDYDGTLVPLARSPELAAPDADLQGLLRRLAAVPGVAVHVVSGRPAATLQRWMGEWPVALWAEHGLVTRPAGARDWTTVVDAPRDWMDQAHAMMSEAAASAPGAVVERKTASIAWHYRRVDPPLGDERAAALMRSLEACFGDGPVGVLSGHRVIEVRPRTVHKGLVATRLRDARAPHPPIVAIGDDQTDEDLFRALRPGDLAIRVGGGESHASWRLDDWLAVRALLSRVAERCATPRRVIAFKGGAR